jgi:hypothetical protein
MRMGEEVGLGNEVDKEDSRDMPRGFWNPSSVFQVSADGDYQTQIVPESSRVVSFIEKK